MFQPNKSTCSPLPSALSTPFSFHKVHHICSNLFHLSSCLDENSRTAATVTIVSPGPSRLNWHTVGASAVHTHLHAFAHATPPTFNACTPISACWTQSCPSKLRSNPNPLWGPPCHCSFQFLPCLRLCRNHLCTRVVFFPCPSPTASSLKAGAAPEPGTVWAR